ncbi:MAG: AAA family ATPase, partial [Campylobacterota bacterium]
MIKYFSVENFSSIKNEVIFEADIGSKTQTQTNKALVFFGANASGKTNILKAITFVFWFIQKSFFEMKPNQVIPFDAFISETKTPSKFYIEFVIGENLYKYTLELTKEKVLYEKLEKNILRKPIYERNEQEVIISRDISKEKVQKDLPKNVSIISFLSRFDSQAFAREIQQYKVISNVTYSGFRDKESEPSELALELAEKNLKEKALKLLQVADTEIVDFVVNQIDNKEKDQILKTLSRDENIPKDEKEKLLSLISSDERLFKKLSFKHKLQEAAFELPFLQESQGTKKLFTKAKDILSILENGGIYIIDEVDSHLHFKIVEYLVSKFNLSQNAQLLCSSHSPSIIDSCFEAKTLWFT